MPDPLRLVAQHKRPEAADLPVSERPVPKATSSWRRSKPIFLWLCLKVQMRFLT